MYRLSIPRTIHKRIRSTRMNANAYDRDLAYIHDAGFGELAKNAARELTMVLNQIGHNTGRVVDLGCGSAVLAEHMVLSGYAVTGFDISRAMIRLARARVPTAKFYAKSWEVAELPECVAVAAVGEVLGYQFGETGKRQSLSRVLKRIYRALLPGGLLLFDIAGPGRVGRQLRRTFSEGQDWACLAESEEDTTGRILTRRITTFRRLGRLFRRSHEVHRLRLYPPVVVQSAVESAGFRVRRIKGYDTFRFPRGWAGFLALKPEVRRVAPTSVGVLKTQES